MSYSIEINPVSRVKKVDQVMGAIKKDIENGILVEGQLLPSITAFAKLVGISRDTVEKAYGRLQEMGYLVSVTHKGHYVQRLEAGAGKILVVSGGLGLTDLVDGFAEDGMSTITLLFRSGQIRKEDIVQALRGFARVEVLRSDAVDSGSFASNRVSKLEEELLENLLA